MRKFLAKPLLEEEISAILNAGRRAQSSKNDQAWHFIRIQNRSTLEALSVCGEWAGHLANAAAGIAILTPDPSAKFQTLFDAGQAAAYMQLEAWEWESGLASPPIYEEEKARSILGFPPDLHLQHNRSHSAIR